MELVIDGYNVIRQSPVFKKAEQEGLEVGRETLIKYLEAYRKLKKHKITVVFDGQNAAHLSIQKKE
ncbi:MAG: YacP-like NYN domain protein [Candidatus Methanoperedenaceae archaeon GB50]|nr:MAG: YacP-like NYN domain protein [Candidatus Methanoperedenaceae archaeon GB50]